MLIPSLVLTLALLVGAVPFATRQDFPHLQRAQPQRNSQYKDSLGFGNKELAERDASKYVFMHHIVGNAYPYTYHDWASDFALIGAINVDAVALNIGRDAWQWDRVVDAYKAANDYNADPTRPPLHLFISFDYSSFVCDNGSVTVNWTNYFAQDPAQFKVNGKTFLSTWGGGYDCLGVETWKKVKSQTNSFLMPFFWNSEQTFKTDWSFLDSWYCWGCAWPQGNWNKNTSDDLWYMDLLGSGRYATTVSGWIFTHLPDKNFYLRGDEWLITRRWEQLVQMRNQLTFVEMTTWNDYGESDYFGPFRGAQPAGTYWAENYPHQAWLDLSKYYISAYKTGSYPTITQDVIYWWCRPHFSAAVAAADQYSKPSGWNWSEDYLWAAVFCTSTCSVTLALGSSTQSFPNLPYGVSELKLPMAVGRVKLKMVKSSKTVIDASPAEFEVVATPSKYNYNVYVGAETAIIVGPTPTAISVSIPISISIPFFGTSPSSTSTPIRPTSSSLSTSGSTPSVITTTVSVVPSSTASAYLSIGCVAEGTTGSRRALTGSSYSDKAMTPAKCLTFCRGYKYAGTEYGTQCFCGNSLQNNGATGLIKGSGYCNYRCAGDSSQSCGGSYFLSVYSTSMSTLPAPGSFKSLGCVAEGTTGARRALTGTSYADSAMTPAICQSLCVGYKYAGTEYGSECYCGDTFTNNGASGIIVASSNCNSKCSGDTSQFCGGSYFLSLYQNSV